MPLKEGLAENSPLVVWEYDLTASTEVASVAKGFEWTGLYPGITDSGQRVAFTGRFTGDTNVFPTGDGLFLSTFVNGQWTNRLVLGTNHWGTNVFSRFQFYHRTCVADLSTRTNSVRICFGAASPTGRVGLYAVTYDYAMGEASSLTTLVEAGRDICGLGNPIISFELFDAVNDHGEVVFWVQTAQGDAVLRSGREIEIIDPVPGDPLPSLVDANGQIPTDYARLAASTNKVQGLAADGVTRVVLRVETPGPGQATFRIEDEDGFPSGVGDLLAIGSTDGAPFVQVQATTAGGDGYMAFAVLKAPLDFVHYPEDIHKKSRPIIVSVDFQPQGQGASPSLARRQLNLYRPPVVLMHGIWSDAGTWKWPLTNDPRFVVYPHDYHETHADSFALNRFQPLAAVQIALKRARDSNHFAAVQVDYIGHSMGGLLGRIHTGAAESLIPELRYLRTNNYFAGDFHKLITLDTPHQGTHAADLILDPPPYSRWWLLREAFERGDFHTGRGAVADLQTTSVAIQNMPAAAVPAHAMWASGGPLALRLDSAEIFSQIPDVTTRKLLLTVKFGEVESEAFGLALHDVIVTLGSQRGGIALDHVSPVFDFVSPAEAGVHTSVTGEARVGQRAVELLNAPVAGGLFAMNGFPANSPAPPPLIPSPSPKFVPAAQSPPPAFVQGLNITSPVSGTNVPAGASVSVTVAATNGFQPAKVLLIGPWGADLDETAPFALTVNVPANWLGPLAVKAFGVDTNGIFAEAPEIVLNVNTTATLTNLALRPDTIYLFDYAQSKQVEVFGQFSDGVERKLTPPLFAPAYLIVDPAIASVTTNGLVQAQRLGTTTLLVRHGLLSAMAHVQILGAPFTSAPPQTDQALEIIEIFPPVANMIINPVAINNAGQFVFNTAIGSTGTGPAIWQNGQSMMLPMIPGANSSANAITESGIVGGYMGGPVIWPTLTNYQFLNYTNGPLPPRWYGSAVQSLFDSDMGLLGFITVSGPIDDLGNGSPSSMYRFTGTDVGQPVIPSGIPPGYFFEGVRSMNRHGTLLGNFDRNAFGSRAARVGVTIDARDQSTVISGDYHFNGIGINEVGDAIFGVGSETGVLWHEGQQTVVVTGNGARAIAVNNRGHVLIQSVALDYAGVWASGQVLRLGDLLNGNTNWSAIGTAWAMNDRGWIACEARRPVFDGWRKVILKLAPGFPQQPISRTKVPGQSVSFSVTAAGVGSMTYQWRKDGVCLVDGSLISGATSNQLTRTSLSLNDAGSYDVVVRDAYGVSTSKVARLTVFAEGCLPPASDLVAHWTADGTFQEAANSITPGRPEGGIQFRNGFAGGAFSFDGINDAIVTELDVQPSTMPSSTWEAWVYPTRVLHNTRQQLFSVDDGGFDRSVLIEQQTDRFAVFNGWESSQFAPVTLNEWQHIAVVFAPDRIEFFKNGVRTISYRGALTSQPSGARLNLGRNPLNNGTEYFQGMLDEVTIYQRALSADEIQAINDVGSAAKCRPQRSPVITRQPLDQSTYAGFDVKLTIDAQGSAPMDYRWYVGGNSLIGQVVTPSFTLSNAQPYHAGAITCVASNAYGMATSSIANLVVRGACENEWRQVANRLPNGSPLSNLGRNGCVFDSARGVIVICDTFGKTWEWNGSAWRIGDAGEPANRFVSAMAYDPDRRVTVLFGGYIGGNDGPGALSDTREWNGTNWSCVASCNPNQPDPFGPAPRYGHAMVYDSALGRTILYGGSVANNTWLGDMWEWDGLEWTQLPVGGTNCASPGPRYGHKMVYDSARQRIVLFGGRTTNGVLLNDTWEWDGTCWTKLAPIQSPPLRQEFNMAYHAGRQTVILVGGQTPDSTSDFGDTWELIGDSWIQVATSSFTVWNGGIDTHVMDYDSNRDAVVLSWGDKAWEWSSPRIPVLAQQPVNQTRFVGDFVAFNACAVGQGTVGYQWFLNGTNPIAGATQSALVFNSAQAPNAGAYTVVVSNAFGSVTSVVARLTLLPCQNMPAGLISWWRAEGDAQDAAGTNHGLLVNGAGFASGKVGQALRFDGVNDHVKINRSASLNLSAATGLTVEGWVNPRDLAPRPLLEWNLGGSDNASIGAHLWTSAPDGSGAPGSLYLDFRRTNLTDHILVAPAGTLTSNTFQHIAFTYNRPLGSLSLYHDGALVAQQTVGSFRSAVTNDLYLGWRPGTTNVFAGLLDEFALYNRELTSNEVASIYTAGAVGKCVEPDGIPYVYLNGVNYPSNQVTLLTPPDVSVAMLSTFSNATVRYTLDGSAPSNGTLYTGTFGITQSLTLRAIANDISGQRSAEADPLVVTLVEAFLNRLQIARLADGRVRLNLRGVPDTRYLVQATTNFVHWVNLTNMVATANLMEVMDTDVSHYPQRFYRWVLYDAAGELGAVTQLPGGGLSFQLSGLAGRNYVLQASPDLQHWTDLSTNIATTGILSFTNLIYPAFPQRFFRLKSQP